MQKVKIEFKEADYKRALQQHSEKEAAGKKLIATVTELLNEEVKDPAPILKDALNFFYERLEARENPYNLKGEKLAFLWELDTTEIEALQKKYKTLPFIPEPTEEAFTVYAETPEQMERLKLANDLLEVTNRCKAYTGDTFINLSLFRPIVRTKFGTNDYEVNPDFVMKGKQPVAGTFSVTRPANEMAKA